MPFDNLKLRFLTPELQKQLDAKHESDVERFLPIAGVVFGFLIVAFAFRDLLIGPVLAPQAFLVHLACVGMAAIAFWRSSIPWNATQRAAYIYWVYLSTIILLPFVLDYGFHDIGMIVAAAFLASFISLEVKTFLGIVSVPLLLFAVVAMREMPFVEYIRSLMSYAFAAGLALVMMLVVRFLRHKVFLLETQLMQATQYDSLTGLFNRGYLTELAAHELMRARRHERPLAVAMLDIDHFNRINDTFGHETAELAVRAVADACRAHLREIDLLARVGRDVFLCLLPEAGESDAVTCGERLRAGIEALAIDTPKGQMRFTASIGVAVLGPQHVGWSALLREADAALYRAKCEGRNRVLTASAGPSKTLAGSCTA